MTTTTPSGNSFLNTGALIRSAGAGLAIGIVIQIINFGVNLAFSATGGSSSFSSDASAGLAGGLGVVSICICCVMVLMYGAIGAAYGWFVERSGSPLEMGPAAAGGALASFIDGIILGICGVASGYLSNVLGLGIAGDSSGAVLGSTLGLGGATIGLVISVCVFPFVYAVLGAAGAAIFAAIRSSGSKPPQPAAM